MKFTLAAVSLGTVYQVKKVDLTSMVPAGIVVITGFLVLPSCVASLL